VEDRVVKRRMVCIEEKEVYLVIFSREISTLFNNSSLIDYIFKTFF
jgi:hypothetical protein